MRGNLYYHFCYAPGQFIRNIRCRNRNVFWWVQVLPNSILLHVVVTSFELMTLRLPRTSVAPFQFSGKHLVFSIHTPSLFLLSFFLLLLDRRTPTPVLRLFKRTFRRTFEKFIYPCSPPRAGPAGYFTLQKGYHYGHTRVWCLVREQ